MIAEFSALFVRIKTNLKKTQTVKIQKIISARCGQAERDFNCFVLALSRKKSTL
jgi:hypothetical protein